MVIVNLNKHQILLKTVELGSITRAAEALGYTQSAVSRVIADLEREWDMELLTRSRTGVVLSSSGAALLPYVQAVCNAGRELEEQVAELHGLTRGTLRVATFASVSIHWRRWRICCGRVRQTAAFWDCPRGRGWKPTPFFETS